MGRKRTRGSQPASKERQTRALARIRRIRRFTDNVSVHRKERADLLKRVVTAINTDREQGTTFQDIAAGTHISTGQLSYIVSGDREPSLELLMVLAQFYGLKYKFEYGAGRAMDTGRFK